MRGWRVATTTRPKRVYPDAGFFLIKEARSWAHLLPNECAKLPESTALGARSPYCSVNVLMREFTDPQATILFEDLHKAVAALRKHSHLLSQLRPHCDVPWMPVPCARPNPMETHGVYCVIVFRMWRFEQLLGPASTLSPENKRRVFMWRGAHVPMLLYMHHKSLYADEELSLYVEELFDTPKEKYAPNVGTGIFSADNSLPLLSNRMWSMVKSMFPHINVPKCSGEADAGNLFWEVASKLLPGRCLRRGTASLIIGKWGKLYHLLRWAIAVLLLNGYGDAEVNCNLLKQQEVRHENAVCEHVLTPHRSSSALLCLVVGYGSAAPTALRRCRAGGFRV